MSGTAVMLGVTGILVGAIFLTAIFMQTVLGYSALRTGLAFLPFALAITVGTVVARHLLAHVSPRSVAAAGLALVVGAAALLSAAPADSVFAADLLPGPLGLGWGWAWSSSRSRCRPWQAFPRPTPGSHPGF